MLSLNLLHTSPCLMVACCHIRPPYRCHLRSPAKWVPRWWVAVPLGHHLGASLQSPYVTGRHLKRPQVQGAPHWLGLTTGTDLSSAQPLFLWGPSTEYITKRCKISLTFFLVPHSNKATLPSCSSTLQVIADWDQTQDSASGPNNSQR